MTNAAVYTKAIIGGIGWLAEVNRTLRHYTQFGITAPQNYPASMLMAVIPQVLQNAKQLQSFNPYK